MSGWQLALVVAGIILVMVLIRRISGDKHPFRGTAFSMFFAKSSLLNLVELIASRQWMPRHYGFSDDRELGVAVALESWQPAVTNVICEVNK